jgi:hypothetical protein
MSNATANQSSRYEVVDTVTVLGHPGCLLREAFSGDFVVTVDIDDEHVVTVRGKDRGQVLRGVADAVRKIVGFVPRTAAA